MAKLFAKVLDYMEAEKWKFEIIEGESILRFHFKTRTGRLLCFGDVDESKHFVVFYSWFPVTAQPEKVFDVAEFVTRANRGLSIGNFELDFDNGEVCYKTSLDIEGGELSHKMLDNLLRANLSTCERYFKGLMEVLFGDRHPAEVIYDVEHPDPKTLDEEELFGDSEVEDYLEERDDDGDFRRN